MKKFKEDFKTGVIIIIFSILLLMCGCSLLPSYIDKNNIMDYFPDMREGVIRNYRITHLWIEEVYDTILNESTVDTSISESSMVDEILRVFKSDSISFFTCKVIEFPDSFAVTYIYNKDAGVMVISGDTIYDSTDRILLKTPIEKGNTWGDDSCESEILKTDSTYAEDNVEATNVIVVKREFMSDSHEVYQEGCYSGGLGEVKFFQRIIYEDGIQEITGELIDFLYP
jgi:hypothetical protein